MPQDGYASVSAPELQVDQARDYKPDDATWGEVLIAGAERLNDGLDSMDGSDAPDAEQVAKTVVARLEGSKPLEEMAFDDWWEPDYAQTIALSVVDELEDVDIAWDEPEGGGFPDDLRDQLDRIESAATTAEARTGRIEGTLDDMGAGR